MRKKLILTKLFNTYLEVIVNEFIKNLNAQISFSNDVYESNESMDFCCSFNYTKTPIKIYNSYSEMLTKEIKYIHGSSAEDNIIFGINFNDVNSNVLGEGVLAFTKYFQTIYNSTEFNILEEECSCYNFYLWGHSLGNSDKKYIDLIVKLLDSNKSQPNNINTLTIFFHNLKSKSTLLKKLLAYYGPEKIEYFFQRNYIKFSKNPEINFDKRFKW